MVSIDGGAGGGQLLRWAVALSALTQTPVTVENIRGGRETPGLRPQHVAAISAVQTFTDGETMGVEVGSETVEFEPEAIHGGTMSIDVGTAGSIALVFDAVLPLGAGLDEPLTLTVTGGTDVKWSPPMDYHRFVKLPLLRRFGFDASIAVDRRGFYPKGGGRATLTIEPGILSPIRISDRGSLQTLDIHAIASEDLEDAEVADRQAAAATGELDDLVDIATETTVKYADTDSPGSVVLIDATYEHSNAGFSALGERGKQSEVVGREAVEAFLRFHRSAAGVDVHLADQLLPFLAVAGGRIRTREVTAHIETAIELLDAFGYSLSIEHREDSVAILAD